MKELGDSTITRVDNKYSKSLKYHLVITMLSGGKVSSWHKTLKEAQYQDSKNRQEYKYTFYK